MKPLKPTSRVTSLFGWAKRSKGVIQSGSVQMSPSVSTSDSLIFVRQQRLRSQVKVRFMILIPPSLAQGHVFLAKPNPTHQHVL